MSQKLVFNEKKSPDRVLPDLSWKILIVDDDPDVHEATKFALKGEVILGRSLEFLDALSAAECLRMLEEDPSPAVILMDAVMEDKNSGLLAVQQIRDVLKLKRVRIILRTGQPGDIPELDSIHLYDINDYKTKNELTRNKLLTSVITAIRSFYQLEQIEEGRQGLEQIIAASREFRADQSLYSFGREVLNQASSLFHLSPDGFICRMSLIQEDGPIVFLASSGTFSGMSSLDENGSLTDPETKAHLKDTFSKKQVTVWGDTLYLYFSDDEWAYVTQFKAKLQSEIFIPLLSVFCANMALAAKNMRLYARMEQLAYEDPILKIPNLSALIREIERVKNSRDMSLYLVDVNQFGTLNDLLGHDYGDMVLEAIVKRLQDSFADSFVSRISGDVFAVISDCHYSDCYKDFFREPIPVAGGFQQISISTGCLPIDDPNLSGSDYLKNAHIALKRAKTEGIGKTVLYNPVIGLETRERIRLLQELRTAFAHEKMFLMFQPQVSLKDDSVIGFEALLRWKTAHNVFISPDRFIPLAEQGGLIVPMGTWILRMALHTLSDIHNAGFKNIQMAINVSAIQLKNPDFLSILKQALSDTMVNPAKVELEITESVAVMGVEKVVSLFRDIQNLGVSIAIDDFGTGYSSLSSIDQWPADRLKIDRAFVSGIEKDKDRGRIVDLVIPLGKKLGMQVLAEGIETIEQAEHLKSLGCEEGQGYLYSKPLEYEDALQWLKER